MPTYEYRCAKCGDDLEVYQSFSEAPLTKHKGCGGKLSKVMSPAGIVLKGSGFYKTDNRGSSKGGSKRKDKESTTETAAASTSSDSSSSDSSSSSETPAKKTETKSESASTKST